MKSRLAAVLLASLLAMPAFAADMKLNSVPEPDSRQLLQMPAASKNTLRIEMLERMQALQQVLQAIAEGKPQDAAQVAKAGIGMGVMMRHDKRPADAIPRNYMPEGMKPLSMQSHKLGDELSEALKSGDRKRIDGKLGEVVGNCVACHNLYRIN
jgi:cytochrome c556